MASCCLSAPLRALSAVGVAVMAPACFSSSAAAHVTLDAPNGGQTLEGGSTFAVQWRPTPGHDTLRWALWYSTESDQGPWVPIDLDIEVGDPSTDSIHLYDWTVPEGDFGAAWVRVLQANDLEEDYYDVSDASFRIVAPPLAGDLNGDGRVDVADYTVWRDGLGSTYEISDYVAWRENFGATRAAAPAAPTPEPSGVAIGLACAAAVGGRRR